MNHLDTIAPLRGPAPEGAVKAARKMSEPRTTTRRRILGGALAAGAGVGMAALGVFPPARRAMADGYDILNSCPPYASTHDCSPGCGPSPVCADCCQVIPNPSPGWHKDSTFGTYALRPNQCLSGTGWDGWNWRYALPCAGCSRGVTWRCHDGWKWTIFTGWAPTICRFGWCI